MQVTPILLPAHHTVLGFASGVLLCYLTPVSWSDAERNLRPPSTLGWKWEMEICSTGR